MTMHVPGRLHPPLSRRSFLEALAATALVSQLQPAWAADGQEPSEGLLHYHSRTPANAEPSLPRLVEDGVTPNAAFYIRSHAPVPEIDPDRYRLSVEGLVEEPLSLSLKELEDLSDTEVFATLTCAGNRRDEFSARRRIDGVPWGAGAIGNARWGGVKLSALLRRARLKPEARHVWFEGLDQIEKGDGTIPFGGSIPLEKARNDLPDMPGALVVLEMNGEPLPPDHGYPVRAVVPGYIGARSVKWLGRIVLSNRPSPNHYVQGAYKIVERDDDLLLAETGPIYRFPLNSAICSPTEGQKLRPGKVEVQGYALAGGSPRTAVARVEVSADAGRIWHAARPLDRPRPMCWLRWSARVPVDTATRQLMVRAIDSEGQMQPRHTPWNMKGYLQNGWHTVPVRVES